jgi:hypothetical protein
VTLSFESSPAGLKIDIGDSSSAAPFTREVIIGSSNSVTAPQPQRRDGSLYGFSSWSDGGARSHEIVAPELPASYTATFAPDDEPPEAPADLKAVASSSTRVDLSWAAAQDYLGIDGYEILRDGSLLTTVGDVTSYTDATAVAGATYTYQVRAVDLAGNESDPSNAATVTTPPTTPRLGAEADALVEEANPDSNYGLGTALRIDGGSDPDMESYLRFRLSGAFGALASAKLRVYATTGTVNGPAVYSTASSWSETGITWSNRTARTSGATDDKGAISAGSWVEYDVTSLVSGDNQAYSFILATASVDGITFKSRQAADPTRRPELVLTFTGG